MKIIAMCATFVLGVLVSGCTTTYEPLHYDRQYAHVRSIAVLGDALNEDIMGVDTFQAQQSYYTQLGLAGVLGGVLATAVVDGFRGGSPHTQINRIVESQGFNAEQIFEWKLISALRNTGYDADILPGTRQKRKFLPTYPRSHADAILDVVAIEAGYKKDRIRINGQTRAVWVPVVSLDVKMISTHTGAVLLQNKIEYNAIAQQEGTVKIMPNHEFVFNSLKEMNANPRAVAIGLDVALTQSARTVAALVR